MKFKASIYPLLRLFTKSRKEPRSLFYQLLGFYPERIELYELALVHRSSSIKDESGMPLNNERLEFLGDSVLGAIISDIIYNRYQNKKEGFLTNTRSKIVQRESLNRLAIELGLHKLVKAVNLSPGQNENIYGNTFEALIGAIYLDQGYEKCKEFVNERVLKTLIDIDRIVEKEQNYKSRLIEWGQKQKNP